MVVTENDIILFGEDAGMNPHDALRKGEEIGVA